ncbi:hypothetical protein BABINDRAFT_162094 [Babjeviella inositovora NRRL Y-12698]|uniref:GPI inositol-deacylase n=1 Tax=Babjeviella inositovora NRRL Y-12698 TaxID=984486 RepID=A0A1E3QPM7_9ASCO|nr:uncharacterized protein BABINDRAFT_162094 [Babjeviella inositovora NRRL Y-12698]ODQ79022.1 hypothetical protein BABINDRAFT_162094 [Babjeviella inositovora NRRL Y-12698]
MAKPLKFAKRTRSVFYSLSGLGLTLLLLIAYVYSSEHEAHSSDAPGCRGIGMYPSYARIKAFDKTHTRFASKYSLYLYREQGKDRIPNELNTENYLNGVPVLFIPGNAGTYKQGRSLAAEASYLYYDTYEPRKDDPSLNQNARNMDFFMTHFNEDFTAFHGRTLLDQATYVNDAIGFILSLYNTTENAPKSVIVVGHSMGGIVSRVIFSLPNYVEESVNTVITLASPHAASPLTFDGDLTKIYSATDKFWRYGYSNESAGPESESVRMVACQRLANVSLISVTGGILDTILPADYTSLANLVPPSNGFTVFTTGIPGVWSPIDHLAIVWCDQLRKKLVAAMMEIVDYRSPQRTYPLSTRMKVMRRHLMSGFEDYASQDYAAFSGNGTPEFAVKLRLDNSHISAASPGERVLRTPSSKLSARGTSPKMNLFHIPSDGSKFEFSMLSSIPIQDVNSLASGRGISVLLCRNGDSLALSNLPFLDFTKATTQKYVELECIDVSSDAHSVPRSLGDAVLLADSSIGGAFSPFNAFQFNSSIVSSYDVVVVAESPNQESWDASDFLIAELALEKSCHIDTGKGSLVSLMAYGADVSLPTGRPLAVNIEVPGAWSSLLAYSIEFRNLKPSENGEAALFEPTVRQWIPDTHETKWHIALRRNNTRPVSIHGVSPFVAFESKSNLNSLNLQLWSDAISDESPIDVYVSVDWWNSLRLLVLRFRLVIGAFPVGIVGMVLMFQFSEFNRNDSFPTFGEGLLKICESFVLVPTLLLLSVATPLCSIAAIQKLVCYFNVARWLDINEVAYTTHLSGYHLNTLFLGIQERPLFFLGPLCYIVSLGIVAALYHLILVVCAGFVCLWVAVYKTLSRFYPVENIGAAYGDTKPISHSPRRMIGTFLLLAAVPFYIPYQLAYIVCCVLQIVLTLRVAFNASQILVSKPEHGTYQNFLHYNISLLMLMLLVLPVNVPVLIVWLHNLSVRWSTPFTSHHNFMAIMPIVVMVEKHMTQSFMSKASARLPSVITQTVLAYMVFFAFTFGVRHAFWLHHLFNFFSGWMLVLLYTNNFNFSAVPEAKCNENQSKLH